MGGRRPMNTELADNKVARKTQKEIKARKEVETVLSSIPATLKCPADLDGKAKLVWDDITTLCKNCEYTFLNNLDAELLKCYCDSVERYSIASSTWKKNLKKLVTHPNKDTQKVIDKCLFEMNRSGDEMCKYARALNLTSSDRERLAVANGKFAKKEKSSMMQFMNNE
jgi:P27 family predicted phage terminase small subunit